MFNKLVVTKVARDTKDSVAVTFTIPKELTDIFKYTAGQFITLKAIINGNEVRRSYSICTAPFEGLLTIGIKKVPGGIFSTYANEVLKAGDVLEVMPPAGNFYKENTNSRHVAFACGSGITPILSIIKQVLHTNDAATFTLVYSNKNKKSIMFFEAVEALKNKYVNRLNIIHLLSREKTDAPINYGRINEEKLDELQKMIDYNQPANYYICGPEEMILNTKKYLQQKGVADDNIRFELFGTQKKQVTQHISMAETTDDSPKSNITIKLDGRSFDFLLSQTGDNILDAALAQGADLPYACKGGVCCTCKAKLLQGTVSMDVNYALEPDEVADGFILTCQSHPTSEKVVVDFDIK